MSTGRAEELQGESNTPEGAAVYAAPPPYDEMLTTQVPDDTQRPK